MDYTGFTEYLKDFPGIGERQMECFRSLEGLYKDWNSKINVISRKDIDSLYLHHVLHSLAIAAYLMESGEYGKWQAGGIKVLDVGTGGGFPGIPLAILFPEVQFTLCDSIGKKIKVADGVSSGLGLENVRTVVARAETLPDTYNYIVSRAVTSLDNFLPWVKRKYSDAILYLKGGDVVEETASAMKKCRLPKGSIGIWKVDTWIKDPYFEGKLVVRVEKF